MSKDPRVDAYIARANTFAKPILKQITLGVFVQFAVGYMRQPVTLNFLWAGLCLMGAVYFMFR